MRDLYRHYFGRLRLPEGIKRLGMRWMRVFELFCWQAWPEAEIAQQLEQEMPEAQPAESVAVMVRQLRSHKTCRQVKQRTLSLDTEEGENQAQETAHPSTTLQAVEINHLLAILFDHAPPDDPLTQRVAECWQALSRQLTLSDDQRLILRLIYQDGHSANKAAKMLNQPRHKVNRAVKKALQSIRSALAQLNIDAADLLD